MANPRQKPLIVAGVTILLLSAAASSAQDVTGPRIVVTDSIVFFDRTFDLSVMGLIPGEPATVTITAVDSRGQEWWSQNVYTADASGQVTLATQAPIRGTYSGTDAQAPFWSMVGSDRFYTETGAPVQVRVAQGPDRSAVRELRWLSPRNDPSILWEEIRSDRLTADLYLPAESDGPVPVVIVVGGSGGGFNSERASLLASHGYAALDVAYFGAPGRPRFFVETQPIEYFMGAVSHLAEDPRLDLHRLTVMGRSFGAQLALVWASMDSRINAVIAEAPSSYVTGTSASYPFGPVQAAWSIGGRDVPHSGGGAQPSDSAMIPVERIGGPVLFISGDDDRVWDSSTMIEEMLGRLEDHSFGHPARHIRLENAGHNLGGGEQAFGIPSLPAKDRDPSPGGTAAGNAKGAVVARAEALTFLPEHVRRGAGG